MQLAILTVSDQYLDYAKSIKKQLKAAGFRPILDERNEKLGFKIRDFTLKKVPYEIIIGETEQTQETVSLRCVNGDQETNIKLDDLLSALKHEVTNNVIPDSQSRYGFFQKNEE